MTLKAQQPQGGGVEATAREIAATILHALDEHDYTHPDLTARAFLDAVERIIAPEIAAALRAAPTLEHSRLEGNAIGQPTSVVTHDSEGRGMKFRKRPVVIDAMRLQWKTWSEMCDFAGVGVFGDGKPEGCYIDHNGLPTNDVTNIIGLLIPTLEGTMVARQDDWIIRGIKGELYPCKPDIFAATYEAVAPASGEVAEPAPGCAAHGYLGCSFCTPPDVGLAP